MLIINAINNTKLKDKGTIFKSNITPIVNKNPNSTINWKLF